MYLDRQMRKKRIDSTLAVAGRQVAHMAQGEDWQERARTPAEELQTATDMEPATESRPVLGQSEGAGTMRESMARQAIHGSPVPERRGRRSLTSTGRSTYSLASTQVLGLGSYVHECFKVSVEEGTRESA